MIDGSDDKDMLGAYNGVSLSGKTNILGLSRDDSFEVGLYLVRCAPGLLYPNPFDPLRSLQISNDQCLCPIGEVEFRPPTRDEFNDAFNETIMILIDDNEITFIDEIDDLEELEETDCPTAIDERETCHH